MPFCEAQQVVPVLHAQGQVVHPAGVVYVRHTPATHTWSASHALPQRPQASSEVCRLKQ